MSRIDAALGRIERASARIASGREELVARHARLRQAVDGSLAEIDRLIAMAEK